MAAATVAHHNGHEEHRLVVSDSPQSRPYLDWCLAATKVGSSRQLGGRQRRRVRGDKPQGGRQQQLPASLAA